MHERPSFSLTPLQVPECPPPENWVDVLRWCVAVMDDDDDDIGFVASLLSYAFDHRGLTEKQAKYAKRVVLRVRALWLGNQLKCQHPALLRSFPSLATTAPEGNA